MSNLECQQWFLRMAMRERSPGEICVIGNWLIPAISFNDPTVQLICIPPIYTREQELEAMLEVTADLIKSNPNSPASLLAHLQNIYDLIDRP